MLCVEIRERRESERGRTLGVGEPTDLGHGTQGDDLDPTWETTCSHLPRVHPPTQTHL